MAEYIRSAYELGDPKWREMAIAHLRKMMTDPDSANRIAAVLKVMSDRTKH